MEFKEIKIIKDWLIALVYYTEKNTFLILCGKYSNIKLDIHENTEDMFFKFDFRIPITTSETVQILIPLIENNHKFFTLITLHNKQEYETIILVLEEIL